MGDQSALGRPTVRQVERRATGQSHTNAQEADLRPAVTPILEAGTSENRRHRRQDASTLLLDRRDQYGCMPKRRRYYRRPGHRPRWRPLGELTEDELFILSIVTVLPGVGLHEMRDVYLEDCELVARRPLGRLAFLRRVDSLIAHGFIRRGIRCVKESPEAFFPTHRVPSRSLRRLCFKKPVYWF